jgi:hypothetical protein
MGGERVSPGRPPLHVKLYGAVVSSPSFAVPLKNSTFVTVLAYDSVGDMRTLYRTGTGTWQALGQRDTINRDYGGHALFDVGKMIVAGGGPSTKDALVVDLNGATPQVSAWRATTPPRPWDRSLRRRRAASRA